MQTSSGGRSFATGSSAKRRLLAGGYPPRRMPGFATGWARADTAGLGLQPTVKDKASYETLRVARLSKPLVVLCAAGLPRVAAATVISREQVTPFDLSDWKNASKLPGVCQNLLSAPGNAASCLRTSPVCAVSRNHRDIDPTAQEAGFAP